MDTLEYNTVAGHPDVSVMHDKNLMSDMILQRLGKAGCHMMSAYDSIPPSWCQ